MHVEFAGKHGGNGTRHRRDRIGRLGEDGSRGKARNVGNDIACRKLFLQRAFRDLMRVASSRSRDEDVPLLHEFGERGVTAQTWMVLPKNAHVSTRKKLLPANPRNEQRKFSDREIDLARFQRKMEVLQVNLRSSQPHTGCRVQEQLHDSREQHDHAGVESEHPERSVRLAGVETGLFAAKALHAIQQRANRLLQFKRFRRRLHVQGHANEQRIVEIAAQARQSFAERRLLRVQRFGGSRQASFAKQHIEDPKCVQVEIVSLLPGNSLHSRPDDSLATSFPLR